MDFEIDTPLVFLSSLEFGNSGEVGAQRTDGNTTVETSSGEPDHQSRLCGVRSIVILNRREISREANMQNKPQVYIAS